MKKIVYILLGISTLCMMSCEKFLDTTSYTKKNTSNFPQTLEDATQLVTGIYAVLNKENMGDNGDGLTFFLLSDVASDDMLGGGGENDKKIQALDLLMNYQNNMLGQTWGDRYEGIYRANMVLETIDDCAIDNEEQKNQMKGEAYFLRSLFYFDLVSLYGEVPLVVSTETENLPKAPADELYAQIASDLKNAIELMSDKPYDSFVAAGHATKWAAEALMARVFLFYTGFYGKADLPLAPEGSIAKAQVISWLEDCIDNSGHSLVPDYRNLWPYTNRFTVKDYDYTKGQNLSWVENDGAVNPETIFSIKYSNFSSYDEGKGYGNQTILRYGLRGGQNYENTFPYGQGWGWCPVNPKLWNDWEAAEPNDLRRSASIVDIPEELPGYSKGGWNDYVQETDYVNKKYMPVTARQSDGGITLYSSLMYGTTEDYQLGNTQDLVLIRLADVYLMHSELTETATYMNKVRERAGLNDETYSLKNIQNERRWELAFEGLRWNDIRRWGIAADVLESQVGEPCYFKGEPDVTKSFGGGYSARYNETKGFYPIPDDQISLSEKVLTQNDGWGTSAAEYNGWK